MILDATAGNRITWRKNKNPDNVVFLDKEYRLAIPPTVIATWKYLPFRDDSFTCVYFDPPFTKWGKTSIHNHPIREKSYRGASWYGNPSSLRALVKDIILGQKEFARVSKNLCFKWCEISYNVDRVLTCFTEWEVLFKMVYESRKRHGKSKTWLVKLTRKM
jgi:hypothetical protein